MQPFDSSIDTSAEEFLRNREAMLAAIEKFRDAEKKPQVAAEARAQRYRERGWLLPRERLNRLLDPGTPFVELCPLAGYKLYDDADGSGAGGGAICGIGFVSGRRCVIRVDNYAVKGGTISPAGMDKALRMQQVALENRLPVVTLAQSGGANLIYATETFAPGGRGFANQARMSAAGIPQVTVVHGGATAGGAYQPGLSDYVVMIRGQTGMYLAGPPLLKAATGEVADEESLGGAEMHCREAGSGDYLAEDDADGIRLAREIVATLPKSPQLEESCEWQPPIYPDHELLGVVPADSRKPYDVRELLARIADGSALLDFKPEFDQQTVCAHIRIEGRVIGVLGNNGPITPGGANKAAQFIQLCDQGRTPLLFLHNTTGFMVGTAVERQGIIKHGSKMIQAVANARVPKISIVVGGSYGAGNYAMCGRGFDPRFIFAWPNARTAVMGASQAGKVMRIVSEQKMQRSGAVDEAALDKLEADTAAFLDAGSDAISCSARLWDDGIIDPRDTRRLLGFLLEVCHEADAAQLATNTFGVARF
ncbi:Methylmalonyl-CoA carboxyltransferase 12S subunit [Microbulbifer aggregans]|uniref:Methylmalonyl-CoA carboxyltransferase 12S subunit n=1 Tax=Microbulbifer aggregans TaxID=1769779 RepID=A0A1C9WAD0_9GAMM|nr:acyl-CoA carboxylase subunit beta [Microbulbifer aggregans]AOS98117.1 Methylmalonyl-CoA carboxyltransferase 12S subunit [Microbulbifer aggregans]